MCNNLTLIFYNLRGIIYFLLESKMIGLVCFNFPRFRATVTAADSFLDAFQRVADVANSSRGKGTVLSGTFSCFAASNIYFALLTSCFIAK